MMPWYPDQFRASTASWTWAEKSVYRSLLDAQWSALSLPNSEERLARIVGIDLRSFRNSWKTVRGKFQELPDGSLQNFRLEQHRLAALARKETFANSGRLGGLAKAQRGYSDANSDAVAMPQASLPKRYKPLSPSEDKKKNSVLSGEVKPSPLPPRRVSLPDKTFSKNGGGRKPDEEPEERRLAKALLVLEATPDFPLHKLAEMFHITVAAIQEAKA